MGCGERSGDDRYAGKREMRMERIESVSMSVSGGVLSYRAVRVLSIASMTIILTFCTCASSFGVRLAHAVGASLLSCGSSAVIVFRAIRA